jgi:hypothetical protein
MHAKFGGVGCTFRHEYMSMNKKFASKYWSIMSRQNKQTQLGERENSNKNRTRNLHAKDGETSMGKERQPT